MKHRRLSVILVVVIGLCVARIHAQTAARTYRIDLSGRGEFKDIFDAGLQPSRFDDVLGICVIKHTMINFDLGHSNSITIPADECYFKVLADYSLYTIEANTSPLTLEEARKWMLPVCRTFGTPIGDLDDFLARVAKGEIDRFGWVGRGEEAGFGAGMRRQPQNSGLGTIGAQLRSVAGDKLHPVEIAVSVRWERLTWKLAGSPPKLTPPKGYEQVSMEPVPEDPEWLRNGGEPSSFVKALNTPQEIQHMRDEYNARHQSASVPVPSDAPREPGPGGSTAAAKGPSSWMKWLLMGSASFCACGLLAAAQKAVEAESRI